MTQKSLEKHGSLGWQETFDAALDIFALISKDFEILKLNKAGYENLGKSLEEMIGKKCYKVVHGLNAPIENCPCKKILETGNSEVGEISDHGRHYLATAAPIFDNKNEVIAFAHTVKDITVIRETEKSLNDLMRSLEQEVEKRTNDLLKINEKLKTEIKKRKKSQQSLKKSELLLKKQTIALEQKNTALKEVISQIEVEKSNIRNEINCNVELILLPILERIKFEKENDNFISLLRDQLKEISSPYGYKLNILNTKLTPREIEICNMIKANLSSKEIASLLHISIKTVNKHRRNIRHKLEIKNMDINLSSYLKTL
jgi:PAS domain S-box-containing protein